MKLCIADPPYLGRASTWYGDTMAPSQLGKNYGGKSKVSYKPADHHPDAAQYDSIEAHESMVQRLVADYDGWAIAMAHDNLRDYMGLIPPRVSVRVCIWTKQGPLPGGSRIVNWYEPVLVHVPEGRRAAKGQITVPDSVRVTAPRDGFAGKKPEAWTRWVLDLMGYDPETDTVDDLFHGSGAVSNELRQGVLL
jgi:hypothetical protein